MTGVRRDLQTDPTITWCHSRGKQGFITWPQATPTLSYVGRGAEASNYPHYNKLCTMCVCVSWELLASWIIRPTVSRHSSF